MEGVRAVPLQMCGRGEGSPGADVASVGAVPVQMCRPTSKARTEFPSELNVSTITVHATAPRTVRRLCACFAFSSACDVSNTQHSAKQQHSTAHGRTQSHTRQHAASACSARHLACSASRARCRRCRPHVRVRVRRVAWIVGSALASLESAQAFVAHGPAPW